MKVRSADELAKTLTKEMGASVAAPSLYYGHAMTPGAGDFSKPMIHRSVYAPRNSGNGKETFMRGYKKGGAVKKYDLGGDVGGYLGEKIGNIFGGGETGEKIGRTAGEILPTALSVGSALAPLFLNKGGKVMKRHHRKSEPMAHLEEHERHHMAGERRESREHKEQVKDLRHIMHELHAPKKRKSGGSIIYPTSEGAWAHKERHHGNRVMADIHEIEHDVAHPMRRRKGGHVEHGHHKEKSHPAVHHVKAHHAAPRRLARAEGGVAMYRLKKVDSQGFPSHLTPKVNVFPNW